MSNFVNLLDAPYSRRGSYICFANDNFGEDLYGKGHLWFCNCRVVGFAMSNLGADSGYRQIKVEAVKDGISVPYNIKTTPYEVILETRYGEVKFCIGERNMAMAKSEAGLGIRLTPQMKFMVPTIIDMRMPEGRYSLNYKMSHLVVTPVKGKTRRAPMFVEVLPGEDGIMLAALEDWMIDPTLRPLDEYPSYEEEYANVKADFDEFCEKVMPELPGEYEEARLQSLWQTWNMIVEPDGQSDYKHTMVKMIHCIFESAFVWQQPMQAIWLSKDPKLSWNVFCSSFDFLDANGRMCDGVGFKALPGGDGLKPPIQGAMLEWLLDNGIYDDIPVEDKKWLLEGLIKWTNYFLNFRDKDHDGLCEFQNVLETGWEDASYYNYVGFPCCSPDINTFVAIQCRAVARLGALCGMPEEEQAAWKQKAETMMDKIIETFWDGETWFAFNPETGVRSKSFNISLYMGMMLGDRLPQEIIDKSIANMFGPDGFDTPYGLASEGLTSDYFQHGFTSGSIITPAEFLSALMLEKCGRFDLAKKISLNYCKALKNYGFFHIYNALTGKEDRNLTAFGEKGLFWSAWTSSCYFWMANRYGKE